MADFLGRSPTDVLQIKVTELGEGHRTSRSAGLDPLLALHAGQQYQAETAFRRADGATVWGSISASIIASGGSGPYGMCLVEDITGRKHVEAELQHLAMHDQLTGLPNRVLFMDRVEHALAAAERRGPGRVGLIFLDLDRFKVVNDTWGHGEGDNVLKTMAERIVASIRPGDTAARLGGDEFAVLCPAVSGVTELDSVAKRLQDALRRPWKLPHALSTTNCQ